MYSHGLSGADVAVDDVRGQRVHVDCRHLREAVGGPATVLQSPQHRHARVHVMGAPAEPDPRNTVRQIPVRKEITASVTNCVC